MKIIRFQIWEKFYDTHIQSKDNTPTYNLPLKGKKSMVAFLPRFESAKLLCFSAKAIQRGILKPKMKTTNY